VPKSRKDVQGALNKLLEKNGITPTKQEVFLSQIDNYEKRLKESEAPHNPVIIQLTKDIFGQDDYTRRANYRKFLENGDRVISGTANSTEIRCFELTLRLLKSLDPVSVKTQMHITYQRPNQLPQKLDNKEVKFAREVEVLGGDVEVVDVEGDTKRDEDIPSS